MEVQVLDNVFKVKIIRKSNKNTYIRFKNNELTVTTNYFTTNFQVKKIINSNLKQIEKMILKKPNVIDKNQVYLYGKSYVVKVSDQCKTVMINENKIYTPTLSKFKKWYKNEITIHFLKLIDEVYNVFKEDIPFPKLKIRTMTSRWGVCNKKDNSVTLNTNLMKFDDEVIKYVIIHELCHFVHFNHSKDFWNLVLYYCPNYKEIKIRMK